MHWDQSTMLRSGESARFVLREAFFDDVWFEMCTYLARFLLIGNVAVVCTLLGALISMIHVQVLIRPSSKVIVKFLTVMMKHGYINEFEIVDDHRAGKIVVHLNGRLNKVCLSINLFRLCELNPRAFILIWLLTMVRCLLRLVQCGVISPRFDVPVKNIEKWVNNLLPSRQFGYSMCCTCCHWHYLCAELFRCTQHFLACVLPAYLKEKQTLVYLLWSCHRFVVLTTSSGIMDHEEARRKHTGGKVLGFFY